MSKSAYKRRTKKLLRLRVIVWKDINIIFWLAFVLQLVLPGKQICFARPYSFPIESNSSPKFWLDVAFYRTEHQKTLAEIFYAIPLKELSFSLDTSGISASFDVGLAITKKTNQQVLFHDFRRRKVNAISQKEINDERIGVIDQFRCSLEKGNYVLDIAVTDEKTTATSHLKTDLYVPSFADNLAMSAPQLATFITTDSSASRFRKGKYVIYPNPSRRYQYGNSILFFYHEVYNLEKPSLADKGSVIAISYTITNNEDDSLIVIPEKQFEINGTSFAKVQALDIRGLEQGEYSLTVRIRDPLSGKTTTDRRRFWVQEFELSSEILPMSAEDIKKYREQLQYVASEEDLNLFDGLSIKGKEKFLLDFWHSKDPDPSTPENEFMREHFRRINYAYKNFKGKPNGLCTDMGRVYVVYGPPDEVQRYEWTIGKRPYQIWFYESNGKNYFVFVDRNNDGIFTLVHSTVLQEVKNENWMETEVKY